eukprot:177346-Rhodomonas_salina.1
MVLFAWFVASRSGWLTAWSRCPQFLILLGELPDSYTQDDRMITYVVLTNVVMFLLMLNFLLAIIVEGYTQGSCRRHLCCPGKQASECERS